MAPVLSVAMVRQTGPVFVVGMAVSALGAVGGWLRHRSFLWQDAAVVAVLSAGAALSQLSLGAWLLLGGLCAASLLPARGLAMRRLRDSGAARALRADHA
jgi:uncharacterized membrane protein YhaH (DUF805 family)